MTKTLSSSGLPLVSLVVPAYNHAEHLPEAIKSILTQDYPCLELIVINDGSTDRTVDVLEGFGSSFHWETQINMGQARTLARGWEIAKGDILGYLSADDSLEPNAVSTSVATLMAAPDAVATYCDFNLIDPHSRRVRRVTLPEYSYEQMLAEAFCPVGPGAFFKRSAYQQSGPWNPSYRQMPDYDFWLRLGLCGNFIHLPQVLASFRIHEHSQTYSITTPERAAEPVLIISSVLEQTAADGVNPQLAKRALASANLLSAQLHLRAGRYSSALFCVRQACRHSASVAMSLRSFRMLFNGLFNRTAHRIIWTLRGILKV